MYGDMRGVYRRIQGRVPDNLVLVILVILLAVQVLERYFDDSAVETPRVILCARASG